LSKVPVTSCIFTSNVQCDHIAAGRRIQAVINEMLRQFAPLNDISQGSVATQFRCGEIFSDGIIANFLMILTVKEFRKSVNI